MAGRSSIIEHTGTAAVRNRNARRPSSATHITTFVLPALVHAPLRETGLVYALSLKQVRLYSINFSPRVELSVTGKLGRSRSDGGERSRYEGIVTIYRCLHPLRQIAADTYDMKGRVSDEQALHGTTSGIHCRRPGRSAPNRRPTSHLQKIAADGDEGIDAAAEVSVLRRKEEGLLRERGGGVRQHKARPESAEATSFDDLALRGECIIRRRNFTSHRWTMVRRHWRLQQRGPSRGKHRKGRR